ncbi:hypothetical protein VP01_19g8 [Puccinia sorghi]|uniref:Fork-head domain-containing protein n=1 Tax=Puccinia sorghi TaxID=27349 RepID=A0A0L6VDA4_9BASI|nr:hypothetical protein VP01_19g8 [Puccinia sorghi]
MEGTPYEDFMGGRMDQGEEKLSNISTWDIVALSAEIFDSINEQLQLGPANDGHEAQGEQLGNLALDNMMVDTNSLEYQLHQAVAQEEQLMNNHLSTENFHTLPHNFLLNNKSHAEGIQLDNHQTSSPSLDELLNQTDVSALIQSLLNAGLPQPDPSPPPPPSSSPLQQSIPTPTPSITTHHPPATIDPTLDSNSSPITLSVTHSPEPSLRSDASTSQLPSLAPPPVPQQAPHPAPPNPSSSSSSSSTTLTPSNVKISSLDQLANPPRGQQPNYPWWTIIRAAIMGSRYGILNRDEIFDALQRRWEYFRSTSDSATRVWKSAVGHNLSVKECFVRVHVEGKKNISYYIVDTAVDPAKGRLSKAKSPTNTADRMSIPVITRKLVLPPHFDLSIQARWSPAIAAIRNAKFGYPANQTQTRQSFTSGNSQQDHPSESDSSSDSDSDSDDTTTETEPISTPNPRSGSRLGSSLSAIIEPNSSRRPLPIPRLAFSRSLSNALVAAPPNSRRRNLSARNSPSTSRQAPLIRPAIARNSSLAPPINPPSALQFRNTSPTLRSASRSHSPPDFSSLQDHVNAALADVAASLPEIGNQPHPDQHGVQEESSLQNMMIDIHSSILDPLPEIDLDAILREAQAEVQEEKQSDKYQHLNITAHQDEDGGMLAEDVGSLVPTAADFDRLLASVIFEHGDQPENGQAQLDLECPLAAGSKRSTEDAGLHDLLQGLIDEAQHQTEQSQEAVPEPDRAGAQQEESTEAIIEASRILEAEIEEALKRAEEQEMLRAAQLEREAEAARQRTLAQQVGERLNLQLTASGDIPVHPLPLAQPEITPAASPARVDNRTIGSSRPQTVPRVRSDRRSHARPSSVSRPSTRPMVIRPTLLRCLPHPPSNSLSNLASASASSNLIDRRTRASGARTVGRKLNLPLPSSHTLPPLDDPTLLQSQTHSLQSSSSQIDESTLAPGFLDSIPVVTSDKPRATFPELAKEAIMAHPSGKLTAAEIFKVLEKKYPYFVSAAESWKATLRNVLTSHSCFVKIPRPADAPGRGDWWATVDLPLWKRRRTTAKAKQDEDFVGRHAREHSRRQSSSTTTITGTTGGQVREERGVSVSSRPAAAATSNGGATVARCAGVSAAGTSGSILTAAPPPLVAADVPVTPVVSSSQNQQDSLLIEPLLLLNDFANPQPSSNLARRRDIHAHFLLPQQQQQQTNPISI